MSHLNEQNLEMLSQCVKAQEELEVLYLKSEDDLDVNTAIKIWDSLSQITTLKQIPQELYLNN